MSLAPFERPSILRRTSTADPIPVGKWGLTSALRLNDAWPPSRGSVYGADIFLSSSSTSNPVGRGKTTTEPFSPSRSFVAALASALASATEWIDDREYEEQFKQEIEPIPTRWLKELSDFRNGPEISVRWDEDE